MVTYDFKNKIFKLDTCNSTYALGVYDEGYLLNLYYGKKISQLSNAFALSFRHPSASFSPSNPHIEDGYFSPDSAPLEYSGNGSGDFRISAVSIKNSNGDRVTDFRYVSYKIYKGKNNLEGLPHLYCCENDNVDTLEILMEDKVTGIFATLYYSVFEDYDAIVRSVKINNESLNTVNLERAFSLSLDLPSMDYDLITLYGRHGKERSTEKRPLAHGLQGIASKRGVSSHMQNPFAALISKNADEEQGDAFGFNLVYSGNFEFSAECDFSATTRVLMGINPVDFDWVLEPKMSFQTPEAVIVFSSNGLGEMSRKFHKLYLNNLMPLKWKNIKKPLLINSWEGAYFDFNTDKLVSFARVAKDLGIELLVMDDGWFGKRNSDNCSLGDWYVNEDKLPGGLGNLIKQVNDIGLKFGIWYEPEMISPDSDLYREHPDWCVHVENRENSMGRTQYVLDVSRKDVRDNIFDQMYSIISKYNIEYVKWDFNRNISEAGSALLTKEHKGEFFHRFILGTYELMDRFVKAFPDILFENCSGGGGRFDPGMLYYSPQIWASDNTDPIERLSIQYGTSLCYPASSVGAHVSACDRTGYETKGNVALWGTFGYELDPRKFTDDEKVIVKEQVKEYHKYYNLIHYGNLYRLINPYDDCYKCAWSFVSDNREEALITLVTMRRGEDHVMILKPKGLNADTLYNCDLDKQMYKGDYLMNAGLNLTGYASETGESIKIYLKKVD